MEQVKLPIDKDKDPNLLYNKKQRLDLLKSQTPTLAWFLAYKPVFQTLQMIFEDDESAYYYLSNPDNLLDEYICKLNLDRKRLPDTLIFKLCLLISLMEYWGFEILPSIPNWKVREIQEKFSQEKNTDEILADKYNITKLKIFALRCFWLLNKEEAWTTAEIKTLEDMRNLGASRKQISKALGRTVFAIDQQIRAMGLYQKDQNNIWSDEQIEELFKLIKSGLNRTQISKKIGKPVISIRNLLDKITYAKKKKAKLERRERYERDRLKANVNSSMEQ